MTNFDLIILGNGLAGKCLLYELLKNNSKPLKIAQISSNELAVPCSMNSTSFVSLNGTRTGVSPLGDTIFDSYKEVVSFIQNEQPDGVFPCDHFHLDPNGPNELVNRFGSAQVLKDLKDLPFTLKGPLFGVLDKGYLFYPHIFLPWFDHYLQEKGGDLISEISDFIINIDVEGEKAILTSHSGKIYQTKKLLLASGAYTKIFEGIFPPSLKIEKSKVVSGSFIVFKDINWGSQDVVFTLNGFNLIYRAQNKTLLLGGTSSKEGIDLALIRQLKEHYSEFQTIFSPKLAPFPEFKKGEFISGRRHKGVGRRPFWDQIPILNSKAMVFGSFGHYKNGYSFPFLAAKDLIPKVLALNPVQ